MDKRVQGYRGKSKTGCGKERGCGVLQMALEKAPLWCVEYHALLPAVRT